MIDRRVCGGARRGGARRGGASRELPSALMDYRYSPVNWPPGKEQDPHRPVQRTPTQHTEGNERERGRGKRALMTTSLEGDKDGQTLNNMISLCRVCWVSCEPIHVPIDFS